MCDKSKRGETIHVFHGYDLALPVYMVSELERNKETHPRCVLSPQNSI